MYGDGVVSRRGNHGIGFVAHLAVPMTVNETLELLTHLATQFCRDSTDSDEFAVDTLQVGTILGESAKMAIAFLNPDLVARSGRARHQHHIG